ncbi:hypothetical protein [Streptomyces sp. NPDC057690]|uniref:hypothetical protein n=1 Tax=Streptomyces sp. NPDC057690 TaxID=3346214 RepID=UPI00367ED787
MNHPHRPYPPQPAWGQQPTQQVWGAPPPPPPPKKLSPGIIALIVAGVIAFVAVIVTLPDASDEKPSRAGTSSAAPAQRDASDVTPTETAGLDQHTLTELSVDLAWNGYTEERKDLTCAGVETYGADWTADQMREGSEEYSGDHVALDWDYAAQLVETKCAAR